MFNRRILFVLLLSLFAGNASMAQQQTPSQLPEPPLPAVRIEPPGRAEPEISSSTVPRLTDPVSQEMGSTGDVILDGSAMPGFGVFLHAKTPGTPFIGAKLGSTASYFGIFDSDGVEFWGAYSGGTAALKKNHNSATALEIHNANPGATGVGAWTVLRFMEGTTVKSLIATYGSGWTDAPGGPNSMRIMNVMNAPITIGTNGVERMRISAAGNVGFGTTTPLTRMHLMSSDSSWPRGVLVDQFSSDGGAALFVGRKARGTPEAPTAVANGDNIYTLTPQPYDGATYFNPARMYFSVDGPVTTNSIPMAIRFTTGDFAENERMRITSGGTVGIGTATPNPAYKLDVQGDANFSGVVTGGNIRAHYQDLAEWVPAREELAAGTVVVLDTATDNTVTKSTKPYDTTVAGVVSAQPGILLGVPDPSKAQIATTGRVRVRVDASAASIRRGDLLVTGNKPGTAMKSVPVEVGGVAIHRPGTVLGKALEPLESGEGEILVLLSLQ